MPAPSSLLPAPVVTPSVTRDNFEKSGTVSEIPGQLGPMLIIINDATLVLRSNIHNYCMLEWKQIDVVLD